MKFGKVHTHYQMGNIKLCRQIHRKFHQTPIGFVLGIVLGAILGFAGVIYLYPLY